MNNQYPRKDKNVEKQVAIVMTIVFGIITIFLFKLHWIFGCVGLIAVLTCLLTALFPKYATNNKNQKNSINVPIQQVPTSRRMVYITKSGKKYHVNKNCIDNRYAEIMLESEAKFKGYQKCEKCCK